MSFHQPGVDFSVRVSPDGLQNYNDRNEELLFLVKNTQIDVSIGNVVKRESLCIEIVSDTSHLDRELCVSRASVRV